MPIQVNVFDDDENFRRMLVRVLQFRGCEVAPYDHPASCPETVVGPCQCPSESACSDAIICDLNMPGPIGLDYIAEQIKNGCQVKHIAMMSGYWSVEDEKRAHELGCHILTKPFHVDELNDWLDQIEAERKLQRRKSLKSDLYHRKMHPNSEYIT